MADFKSILTNMAMLGILLFAVISFIVIAQSQNGVDPDNRLTNNSIINNTYGYLESNLSSAQGKAQSASDSFEEIPPSESVGDLDVSSTISTLRTTKSLIIGLWNIYVKLPVVILGVSPIIGGIITTILLVLLVIGGWAIYKGAIS